jgi:hypothetical protein
MNPLNEHAKDFVLSRLEQWVNQFPGLRLRYCFQPCADTHVVAIQPAWLHHSNEQFVKAQLGLMDDVESQFPEHGMVYFIEPEANYLLGKDTITIGPAHAKVA